MSDITLRGLCTHLAHQAQVLRHQITERASHPDLVEVVRYFEHVLQNVEFGLSKLLADASFGAPLFRINHWQTYREYARVIAVLEAYPVPAILAYNDAAAYLRALVQRLVAQINYPLPVPLINRASQDYYWAHPQFNMVGVPILEEHTLLGLPDLVHELGHHLVYKFPDVFLLPCRTALSNYIDTARRYAREQQRAEGYSELLDYLYQQWHDEWLTELVCDAIATFIVGPAYGWQHVRLCSQRSSDLFRPGPDDLPATHPADDARMIGILHMLTILGLSENVANIQQEWHNFADGLGQQPPHEYDLCYPPVLIHQCVVAIHKACSDLGLHAYTSHSHQEGTIILPLLLNEAWSCFRAEPTTYAAWEAKIIEQLHATLNANTTVTPGAC